MILYVHKELIDKNVNCVPHSEGFKVTRQYYIECRNQHRKRRYQQTPSTEIEKYNKVKKKNKDAKADDRFFSRARFNTFKNNILYCFPKFLLTVNRKIHFILLNILSILYIIILLKIKWLKYLLPIF